MSKSPHDEPIEAVAENGEVLLDGPGGIAESFTPEAAKHSAKRIKAAAKKAAEKSK